MFASRPLGTQESIAPILAYFVSYIKDVPGADWLQFYFAGGGGTRALATLLAHQVLHFIEESILILEVPVNRSKTNVGDFI